MNFDRQTTLRAPVTLTGIGVHSGAPASICLKPSSANSGVVFLRKGLDDRPAQLIHAKHTKVSATELCTVIGDGASASVATIEHLMSACAGLGLDNVLVEIDGPEMPIMDGSAARVRRCDRGHRPRRRCRPAARYLKILQPVRVENGRAFAELLPAEKGFRLDVEIDFDTTVIGRQRKVFDLEPAAYAREISRARTFGFMRDVEQLWKAGFALGASLDNTVAIGDDKVINPEGLRYRRRVRPAQGAGRDRRSGARRLSDPGRVPLLLRRPSPERPHSRGAVRRPRQLRHRRGRRRSMPRRAPCRWPLPLRPPSLPTSTEPALP